MSKITITLVRQYASLNIILCLDQSKTENNAGSNLPLKTEVLKRKPAGCYRQELLTHKLSFMQNKSKVNFPFPCFFCPLLQRCRQTKSSADLQVWVVQCPVLKNARKNLLSKTRSRQLKPSAFLRSIQERYLGLDPANLN